MSLCERNIGKRPYTNQVPILELRKDYGLNNINNVNSEVFVCEEIFTAPTIVTNLTKIQTGLTETSIGVFDTTNNEVVFDYTFTGNTNVLLEYEGEFFYEVYPRTIGEGSPNLTNITGTVPPTPIFNNRIVYTNIIPFTELTGLTRLDILPNVFGDQEWILNYSYNFKRKNCFNKSFIFNNTIKNEYDENQTEYFVTLVRPSEITLGPFRDEDPRSPEILTLNRRNTLEGETYIFGVPTTLEDKNECRLVVENLPVNKPETTIFNINNIPEPNSLMISVNGVTLSPMDYEVTNKTVIRLVQPLTPLKDIITATYIQCDQELNSVYAEQYEILSAITSGTTASIGDKVFYNTDQNKFEYYMDFEPEDGRNILLYLNGIKLTYGLDFYMSTTIANRIIFDSVNLTIGDIIYLVYTSEGNLTGDYDLVNGDISLEWETSSIVVNDRLNGEFIVEITESSDTNFSSTGKTQTIVEYEDEQTRYSSPIPQTLQANTNYIWRVISNKVYNGLLGNIFNTSTISRTGKFYTNNEINSY
jgi:hypothetical protein